MCITAKCIIESKYASDSAAEEYLCPAATHTIIDKFTATNTDGSSHDLSLYIVPNGGTADNTHLFLDAHTIAANTTFDLAEIKSHILNPGDSIWIYADVADKVVIRGSGREIS